MTDARTATSTALLTLVVTATCVPAIGHAASGKQRIMPANSSRMDETLTPYNIAAEMTVSQSELDELFENPEATQVYPLAPTDASSTEPDPAAAGTTEDAADAPDTDDEGEADESGPRVIEMAPVDYKGQPLFKRKKPPAPPEPDLIIRLEADSASAVLGSGEDAKDWPLTRDAPIESIQVLTHETLLGQPVGQVGSSYAEFAEKASTYPVVVALAGSRMLVAHSKFQVVETTKTQMTMADGSRSQRTDRDWGFRTGMLIVDLEQMTDDPIDSYRIMLTRMHANKKVAFASRDATAGDNPYEIWFLPVKDDGAFDPDRYGYKMMVGTEITNTAGSRRFVQVTTTSSVGRVSRVKLEGTTPAAIAPPEGVAIVQPVPGSKADPLLRRGHGPGEPTPWGVSLAGGGGYGGDVAAGDYAPYGLGSASVWYGSVQGTFDLNPRYALGTGFYRMGAARDTNYFGLGLSVGTFNEAFGAGPAFTWSTYRRFQGLKLVSDTDLGIVFAEQPGIIYRNSYAVRVPVGNGLFVLPGFFLNLNIGTPNSSNDTLMDFQPGLRLKVVVNGNAGK